MTHRRRVAAIVGLLCLIGVAAVAFAPRPDPVMAIWRSSNLRIMMIFEKGGKFWYQQDGMTRPEFEGTWKRAPAGRVYASDPGNPYAPGKRNYHLEGDNSWPQDAKIVSIPNGANAYLVTLADGDMLLLVQKDRMEIHTIADREFRRLPWLEELQYRFNKWWKKK